MNSTKFQEFFIQDNYQYLHYEKMTIWMHRNISFWLFYHVVEYLTMCLFLDDTVFGYHHEDANAAEKRSLFHPVRANFPLFYASD